MIVILASTFTIANGEDRTAQIVGEVGFTLQQRTYKTGLPASAPVPEPFKKELAGACGGGVCEREGDELGPRRLRARASGTRWDVRAHACQRGPRAQQQQPHV